VPRRLLLLTAVVALAAPPALGGSGSTLDRRLLAALRQPGLDLSRTGAMVVDLHTRRTVFSYHPSLALVPASNEKLPLSYAALLALGPGFRIPTEVRGEGRLLPDGTWRGNLVLKGYGDPTLSVGDLRALAHRLWVEGIRRVSGSIVGDESYFDSRRTAPGWKPSFYLEESPPLSALVVDRARIDSRTALDPALAAGRLFRRALVRQGIRVPRRVEAARGGGELLAAVSSHALARILHAMDRESDNFLAEELLKLLGARLGGSGTTAAGAAVVERLLAERAIPLTGVRIVDGSGLSSLDRLTPRALAAILTDAWREPRLRRYLAGALARPGRTGTLEHRLLRGPARRTVLGKTGTTDESSALSGYVAGRYAFVVIENGNPVRWWAAHAAQDRVAELLAAQ
jgi:D-alanyl-D-alanine carboxypeptidase/D-alanyl-D-alanine-endopeptidase (penicillin-binding protein 4)